MKNKLTKIRQQGKISGVCAGLAKYLHIDVSIIRIAWALISFFYGIGLLVYIICALILPDEADLF